MHEITKIVVPLDLGTHTQKLVDFALYMAKKLSAHISFIHVVEFYATNNLAPISSLEKINQERVERTTEMLTNLIEDNKKKVSQHQRNYPPGRGCRVHRQIC